MKTSSQDITAMLCRTLGADYMEQFQPGLSLSPDITELKNIIDYIDVFNVIQPRLKRLNVRISIPGWVSALVAQTGLKLLSYNRALCFIRI